MIKFADVVFSAVVDEEVEDTVEVSSFPTEANNVISDNAEKKPTKLFISGIITGNDAAEKLNTLRRYKNEARIDSYVGRNLFSNCLITSMKTSHIIKNGFSFQITFQRVDLAVLETSEVDFEIVKPQVVTGNKTLGKKSILEVDEEPDLDSDILAFKTPSYNDLVEFQNEKVAQRNAFLREVAKEQISKWKSEERRRLRPESYIYSSLPRSDRS